MILKDGSGRQEICFPGRFIPRGIELPTVKNPEANVYAFRWICDDDLPSVVGAYNGRLPIYRSVYKFTEFDTDAVWNGDEGREIKRTGLPIRESGIVDKVFFEVECQPCGVLCNHTIIDVRKLVRFLDGNGIDCSLFYSGGKSIHVFSYCSPVNIEGPFKHETVKKLTKILAKESGSRLIDSRAQLGLSQVSRLINTINPKNSLYVIPISKREIMSASPSSIHEIATRGPRSDFAEAALRSAALEAMFRETAKQLKERPPDAPRCTQEDLEGVDCGTIERLLAGRLEPPTGSRHYARAALTTYLKGKGLSYEEVLDRVLGLHRVWGGRDSSSIVSSEVKSNMGTKIPHCPFLRMGGMELCGDCKWK